MHVSEQEYLQLALANPDKKWELVRGEPRRKPGLTTRHNRTSQWLGFELRMQINPDEYEVRTDNGQVRRPNGSYYIPDVMVVPMLFVRRMEAEHPNDLEVYDEPLPLIIEVWSPSTGNIDATTKLADYRACGDGEIWLVNRAGQTLTAWRRQPDGGYAQASYRDGTLSPVAFPHVAINLDALWAL